MAIPALIGLGLGAYGAWQGGKQQKKANDFNDRALAMSEAQFAERAPFRQFALQGLRQLGPRDTSSLFADAGNPFAAARDYTQDFGAQSFSPMVTAPAGVPGGSAPPGLPDMVMANGRRAPVGAGMAAGGDPRRAAQMQALLAMIRGGR